MGRWSARSVGRFDHLEKTKVRLFLDWMRAEREIWRQQFPTQNAEETVYIF